jgi:uncharacterized membrane protein YhhN
MSCANLSCLLLVAGAALAVLYGLRYATAEPSWAKTWVKTGSVVALALAAPGLGAPGLVTFGLWAGALGDLLLSRPNEKAFLAGMGAFAAGHIAYVVAFFVPGGMSGAILPALPLLALGLSTEWWLAPHTGALRWPVRGYVVVIISMAIAALTRGLSVPMMTAGAALFVLSDLMLAMDLFVLKPAPRWVGRALWAAYWGGQALILLGSVGL